MDVGGGSRSASVLGIVSKHEASSDECYRRACTAGEYLVVPGGKGGGGDAPVDIVCVSAADPREWSHVRRYTIQDIYGHAYPCVVGGKIVLVYETQQIPTTSIYELVSEQRVYPPHSTISLPPTNHISQVVDRF